MDFKPFFSGSGFDKILKPGSGSGFDHISKTGYDLISKPDPNLDPTKKHLDPDPQPWLCKSIIIGL